MDIKFLRTLGLHLLLGVFIYSFRSFGNVLLLGVFAYFFRLAFITKKSKRPLVFLYACAYVTSIEVLLRMSGGVVFYEASKYLVIIFASFGIFSKGINVKSLVFVLYLLLLIPSIYISFCLLYTSPSPRDS